MKKLNNMFNFSQIPKQPKFFFSNIFSKFTFTFEGIPKNNTQIFSEINTQFISNMISKLFSDLNTVVFSELNIKISFRNSSKTFQKCSSKYFSDSSSKLNGTRTECTQQYCGVRHQIEHIMYLAGYMATPLPRQLGSSQSIDISKVTYPVTRCPISECFAENILKYLFKIFKVLNRVFIPKYNHFQTECLLQKILLFTSEQKIRRKYIYFRTNHLSQKCS